MKKIPTTLITGGVLGLMSMPAMAGSTPETYVPTPPAESRGLHGNIGVSYGFNNLTGGAVANDYDQSYESTLIELQLGLDIGCSLYAQVDLFRELTEGDLDADETYEKGIGGAFHLMHKPSSLGIFVGEFEVDLDDGDHAERSIAGIEGLFTAGGIDFHWQVGTIFGEDSNNNFDDDDSIYDAYFGRLAGSKDLGGGWYLDGEIAIAFGESEVNGDFEDLTIYSWGVGVDKALTPNWTLGFEYNGAVYDSDGNAGGIVEHYVGLNTTIYFGKGNDVEIGRKNLGLPPIMRWMGISGALND